MEPVWLTCSSLPWEEKIWLVSAPVESVSYDCIQLASLTVLIWWFFFSLADRVVLVKEESD